MGKKLQIGAFELGTPFADGGMGQVWTGRHADLGIPVAIKVVSPGRADNPTFIESFRSEVRSVARLSHPGIVTVYDHGLVPGELSRSLRGSILADSPYLVMEFVGGGTLSDFKGKLSWPELSEVAMSMLAALAHAHARGVIHRDLKPANVLVRPQTIPGRAPRVVITDFGLAHAAEGKSPWVGGRAVGTPGYMAPEQHEGRWRDLGPWTDLFSLGRVVCSLLCSQEQESCIDVPEAFLPWLLRLLETNPTGRFRRAADAMVGLAQMRAVVPGSGVELAATLGQRRSQGEAIFASGTLTPTTVPSKAVIHTPYGHSGTIVEGEAPMGANDWRTGECHLPAPHLIGSGLGLYGMRTIPLVGRQSERDVLWSALKRVHQSHKAELVCLRGASGCGKSRLAEWLCERAHEEGMATVLHGSHGSIASAHDGVVPMMQRYLQCEELSRNEAVQHLGQRLREFDFSDPEDCLAVADLLSPADDDSAPLRLASSVERHHLLARVLSRLARRRTVIVWMDDLQWGLDSLYFIRHLLSKRKNVGRILIVETVQEEALSTQRLAASMLEEMLSMEGSSQVHVGPLLPEERQTLVRQLLGLEETLATRVEAVSAGNPLFAVQVVGEWVRRGLLESSPAGFRLRPGATVEVPDDLHQVWTSRVQSLLDGRSQNDHQALQLAAVLGDEVDSREWRLACHRAGLHPDGDLVDALLERKLAHAHALGPSHGWAFAHGMLRESLERIAREAGNWQGYNLICAGIVGEQGIAGSEARTGHYLLAAGELDRAVSLLTSAARSTDIKGDPRQTRFLIGELEEALNLLSIANDDPRRLEGWLLLANSARAEGRLDEALDWANKVIAAGKDPGREAIRAQALLISARVVRFHGELARAWRRSREAERIAETLGDENLLGGIAREQAWVLSARGEHERARKRFRNAIACFDAAGNEIKLATCLNGLAISEVQSARYEDARKHAQRALDIHLKLGSRTFVAMTLNTLGDIERLNGGSLDMAEAHYRFAVKSLTSAGLGSGYLGCAHMNLGLVLMARHAYTEAELSFESALSHIEGQGVPQFVAMVRIVMLPCVASRGDYDSFDAYLSLAEERLTEHFEVDVAEPARSAGDLAALADMNDLALRAYRFSLSQWEGVGRADEAQATRERIAQLERTGKSKGQRRATLR